MIPLNEISGFHGAINVIINAGQQLLLFGHRSCTKFTTRSFSELA
jgi:hypothetical protein